LRARPEYLQMLIFDLENYLRVFSIRDAKKRGLSVVERADVDNAIRHFGKPEKFAKSEFRDAPTLNMAQSVMLSLLESTKEKITEAENPRVLDAGCGWGRWIVKLHNYCQKDFGMVGVDLDDFSLKYALSLDKVLEVARSNVERLPFVNDLFDLIFCSAVIHEIKSYSGRKRAIGEFHRILKPCGMLCIIDAFSTNLVVSTTFRLLQHMTSKVEWMFEETQLRRMLRANDFTIVNVQKMRYRLFGAIEVSMIVSTK
jgi:SAM-dependent methyltransferase